MRWKLFQLIRLHLNFSSRPCFSEAELDGRLSASLSHSTLPQQTLICLYLGRFDFGSLVHGMSTILMTKIQELAQALVSFQEGHSHICVHRFIESQVLRGGQTKQVSAAKSLADDYDLIRS